MSQTPLERGSGRLDEERVRCIVQEELRRLIDDPPALVTDTMRQIAREEITAWRASIPTVRVEMLPAIFDAPVRKLEEHMARAIDRLIRQGTQ